MEFFEPFLNLEFSILMLIGSSFRFLSSKLLSYILILLSLLSSSVINSEDSSLGIYDLLNQGYGNHNAGIKGGSIERGL